MFGLPIMPKSISPDLIEQGEIKKYLLFQTSEYEISLLELSPGAKIGKHKHINDHEIYFFIKTKFCQGCDSGEEHSLQNDTDEVLQVISIKWLDGTCCPTFKEIFNAIFPVID